MNAQLTMSVTNPSAGLSLHTTCLAAMAAPAAVCCATRVSTKRVGSPGVPLRRNQCKFPAPSGSARLRCSAHERVVPCAACQQAQR